MSTVAAVPVSLDRAQAQADRALLERLAVACGLDTSHSMNAQRMQLDTPCPALLVRRKAAGGELVLVNTGWNPLDTSSCSGPAEALSLAAQFRIPTGFDARFRQFGEVAYATYRTGPQPHFCNSTMVSVKETGGALPALCRAICLAVIAQHEAGQ